ncbi:MAG: uncharacterized protein KVP18_000514 [Porospora cf. gigantea A]|uniref:uncharacterized protein n=1 Tax=Porospora cf. gigantea A TaxID=2853593 RepID=UPI00355A85DB|nr:MAG: hypothetical protein KVP18_000514 [Porospora cf. gigantea A]
MPKKKAAPAPKKAEAAKKVKKTGVNGKLADPIKEWTSQVNQLEKVALTLVAQECVARAPAPNDVALGLDVVDSLLKAQRILKSGEFVEGADESIMTPGTTWCMERARSVAQLVTLEDRDTIRRILLTLSPDEVKVVTEMFFNPHLSVPSYVPPRWVRSWHRWIQELLFLRTQNEPFDVPPEWLALAEERSRSMDECRKLQAKLQCLLLNF